jgi:cytochrome P450
MTMTTPADKPVPSFRLDDAEMRTNPYPAYRWLREHAPAYHVPGTSMWILSRYQDIARVLHDHETFSSYPEMEVPMLSLSLQDPPDHTRLRQTVSRAFTPRQIQLLAPRIAAVAEELMAGLPSACDFITAFANPLPLTIICEMLGIPAERKRDMKRWSRAALLTSLSARGIADPEGAMQSSRSMSEFMEYLQEVIAAHRVQPRENIISALLALEKEGVLSPDELRYFCGLLLIAGHETTTQLLANGTYMLAQDPALWEQLKAAPELVPHFIEEVLRYLTPFHRFVRHTTREVEFAGTTIPAHSLVLVLPGSANRDPAQWIDPDRFDIFRDNGAHLAFGAGIHYCLGASLTRLEGKIAFEVLLRRLRRLHLNPRVKPVPIKQYASGVLGWDVLPMLLEAEVA